MLNVVTPGQALDIILSSVCHCSASEDISLCDAVGRVSSSDILCGENLPAFSRSSVDGLAVLSRDTFGCSESVPAMLSCTGKILMGQAVDTALTPGCCMEIPTGGMLPTGADAAVMIEHTEDIGDGFRYVLKPVAAYENVIRCGDDCRCGSVAVRKGDIFNSRSIALLAALGISSVKAVKKPVVGIISTGDEIIPYTQSPVGSQIRDINSIMLCACVDESGCEPRAYPIVSDNEILLLKAVECAARECDCLLISGGSSVGERDSAVKVLSSLGEVKFHGVAVKPGKPTMFASIGSVPVFGLPGHPAAAFFAFHLFVKPSLCKILGSGKREISVEARLSQNIPSNNGRQEHIAVKVDNAVATPLFAKSGAVAVLSQADGYITVPRDAEGLLKGAKVKVILF